MAITQIGSAIPLAPTSASKASPSSEQPFADTLSRVVNAVEEKGATANNAVSRMLDGTGDVHEAMIAIQQSDMTFHLAVQVRNKLVSAYQEVMRMPV